MLKRLKFFVQFPTGVAFNGDHLFQPGLTSITGPNESAKSLRLELVRFALFGAAALRGGANDYVKLSVELGFDVKGADYAVLRNGSKVALKMDEETLATGTKAVNAKIIELLGYDLTVFDVANSCNQGEVEALGAMKPAERKRMVDQTIGLTTLDTLAEKVGGLANLEKRAAEAASEGLVEPIELVRPEHYTQSAELRITADRLEAKVARLNQLRGWLSMPGPAKPKLSTCNIAETVDQLQEHQRRRVEIANTRAVLQGQLQGLRRPTRTKEELDRLEKEHAAWCRWEAKRQFLIQHPEPQYPAEELDAMEAAINLRVRFSEYLKLCDRLEEAQSHGMNHCPKCQHEWPFEAEQIAVLEKQLEAYDDLPEDACPELPPLSLAEIGAQRIALAQWEALAPQWNRLQHVTEAPYPGVTALQIEQGRAALEDADKRAPLEAQLTALGEVPADRAKDLQKRQEYEWAVAQYDQQIGAYETYKIERRQKEKEERTLAGCAAQLMLFKERLTQAVLYERQLVVYQDLKGSYDTAKATVVELEAKAEQYKLAREAIKELKVRVKQFLVPSLNKVASHLLSQMTNGERKEIVVDEEFNIAVDGQPLNTLSGSGKAVANLAIRIGLGQVLTNKVFSVFMGDEIDASMDHERAGFTAECLRGLTSSIKQVVLVSHKEHEADQYVFL